MPSETRWKEIPCARCNGEGGWITHTTGYAEPVDHVYVCEKCEGSGKIEITLDAWWDAKLGLTPAVVRSWDALFAADAPFLEEMTG
jgi:hypothetical protein